MLLRRAASRQLSSSASSQLASRMAKELQSLSSVTRGSAASSSAAQTTPSSIIPPLPKPAKKQKKEIARKMPEHVIPPYIEANFRTMTFVMTRAPKVSDFPHERVYRHDSLDLLFRHYYKNSRS